MRSKNVAIAAVILVLAFLLNPSPDRHREKIRTDIAERNPIAGLFKDRRFAPFAPLDLLELKAGLLNYGK